MFLELCYAHKLHSPIFLTSGATPHQITSQVTEDAEVCLNEQHVFQATYQLVFITNFWPQTHR